MDENVFKVISAGIVAFMSYCVFLFKRGVNRQDKLERNMVNAQIKINVIDEQMKHILEKLNDVVELGTDLKKSNRTILSALARKAKKD
jgi:hypothetical protein